MGYEDFIKIQQKLDNTEKLWHKVEESKEKFKISVQYNSKIYCLFLRQCKKNVNKKYRLNMVLKSLKVTGS